MEKRGSPTRSLNGRYSVMQGSYWAIYGALFSFAAAFLLDRGFSSSLVGLVLALATLLSCCAQPFLAAAADRSPRFTLRRLILCGALLSWLSLLALLLLPLPTWLYLALYLLGALLLDLLQPLVNALSVYYSDRGAPVNYGLARGVGSLAYAAATYLLGHAMERFGASVVLVFSLVLYVAFFAVALLLPRLSAAARDGAGSADPVPACTLPQFFRRYRWYCLSLVGILFMASFHAMTENYLIVIFENVGGGSGDMGTALALATVLETPTVMLFSRFRHLARTGTWLKLAALAFLAKAVCLVLASSVAGVTLCQFFQPVSYGFYAAAAVYYARERVAPADMVKGQAMLTSFYALGCSLGSFLGGRLLALAGVRGLLWCGILLAAPAAVILWLSAGREEGALPHVKRENPV